jgi:hypothetical protein
MAFNHENHTIDPATGYQVHKDTGHRIGLDQAPPQPTGNDREWPKWVAVHDSHVMRRKMEGAPDHVSVPAFPDFHVNRNDGVVTVLVRNEDEEKLAAAEYKEPGAPVPVDDAARRAVVADVERAKKVRDADVAREAAADHTALVNEEAARRTAEQQELAERNREAAEELAERQRARLAENLAKSPERTKAGDDARSVAERDAAERDRRAAASVAEKDRQEAAEKERHVQAEKDIAERAAGDASRKPAEAAPAGARLR